jgi:hypothetical protein
LAGGASVGSLDEPATVRRVQCFELNLMLHTIQASDIKQERNVTSENIQAVQKYNAALHSILFGQLFLLYSGSCLKIIVNLFDCIFTICTNH